MGYNYYNVGKTLEEFVESSELYVPIDSKTFIHYFNSSKNSDLVLIFAKCIYSTQKSVSVLDDLGSKYPMSSFAMFYVRTK